VKNNKIFTCYHKKRRKNELEMKKNRTFATQKSKRELFSQILIFQLIKETK
jgi:hypothetical protein